MKNITRNNTEIFDQLHQMYAEGMCDAEPSYKEIAELLSSEGYGSSGYTKSYDQMQSTWRWTCNISNLNEIVKK